MGGSNHRLEQKHPQARNYGEGINAEARRGKNTEGEKRLHDLKKERVKEPTLIMNNSITQ